MSKADGKQKHYRYHEIAGGGEADDGGAPQHGQNKGGAEAGLQQVLCLQRDAGKQGPGGGGGKQDIVADAGPDQSGAFVQEGGEFRHLRLIGVAHK